MGIGRRQFLMAAGLGAMGAWSAGRNVFSADKGPIEDKNEGNAMELPNIVVVMTDQLRAFEMGCYGHPLVKTPNLDRLAREGMRFEHACSNNPVCTPARSITLTGQYSRTCTGMLGNWGAPDPTRTRLQDPTLPEVLKTMGYSTAHLGKWHICPHPSLVGFDNHPAPGGEDPGHVLYFPNKVGKKDNSHWVGHEFNPAYENGLLDTYLEGDPDAPFFLFHNINLPHSPWHHVPKTYRTRYDRDDVTLRPNVFDGEQMADSLDWYKTHWGGGAYRKGIAKNIPDLPQPFDLKNLYAMYYGMIECVDDQVGHLLDRLKASGKLDNTLILFTSDHGDNLGSHQLWNKETMNEESIRIPLIAWWPGKVATKDNTQQVISLVDIAPTILGMIGQETPEHMQGRDLSPVLRGEKEVLDPDANYIFSEGMQNDVAVRTLDHMYGIRTQGAWNGKPRRTVADDTYQFFDMSTDPYQMENLAKTDTQKELSEELRNLVLKWDKKTPWQHERPEHWKA